MPVYKRVYKSGEEVWSYLFSGPGATREDRRQCTASGFATKKAAQDAEAARRTDEQKKYELELAGGVKVAEEIPKTLATLLVEFFKQHAEENLAPKTIERYRECATYLAPELVAMRLDQITPLHLNREWKRLLTSGGHSRKKAPRPMSAKTVRNIAGVVSSAFGRAVKWGLVLVNPVTASEPPIPKKRRGIALTTAQQDLLIEAASGPWCLSTFLAMDAALGARRGEVLALRWSDVEDGRAVIGRSLCQTKGGLEFKSTKTEEIRVLGLPEEALAALEVHRKAQGEFRAKFGSDYRADLDLIFANTDGTPLRPDSVSATVSALFKRLKIAKPKGAALHLLRHSHGSHMLAQGVPLPAVSARLGHSSVRVTADVYAHAIHGQDDEAVRKWEEYQRQSRATAAIEPQHKGQVQ
ncbi:MAG: tyrosine-type recombinase/integrase [Bryobacteraceae bacterium]|jgi:integrase